MDPMDKKHSNTIPKQALLMGTCIVVYLFLLGIALKMDHFLLDQLLICTFILFVIFACRVKGRVF